MSENPRIAIVTSTYCLPGQTFVNHHVQHLFGGNTVVVCLKARRPWPDDRPVLALDEIAPGPLDRALLPVTAVANLARYGWWKLPAGRQSRALADFLRRERIEAVLCEFGHRAPQILPVAEALGLPVFAYFRGVDASKLLREFLQPYAYRRAAPRLAGTFAVAQHLFDSLAAHGIVLPNAEVIPSGADTTLFTPGEKRPREVVAVGRMVDKKRPDITMRAFIAGAQEWPDARFAMIGDGPMLRDCRAMAREAGVADRIDLPGVLPHPEVARRLTTAAIFVQHSVTDASGNTEGLPSVIQEAMACGCAIVSTRHAGIPEAVTEGETGLLVEENDATGYAAALQSLLADPARTGAMGAAGRAYAEEHLDKRKLTDRVEAKIQAHLVAGGA